MAGTNKTARTSRNSCCAYGCSNNPATHPDLADHRFPERTKQTDRFNAWVSAVRRKDWQPSISSVLCSSHFTKECYRRPPGLKKRALLNGDAIPSIFIAHPQHLQPVPTKKRRVLNRTATFTSCSPLNSESDDAQVNPEDQTVQTTYSWPMDSHYTLLGAEHLFLAS